MSSGGPSDDRHVNDPVQGHVHDLASTRDTDTDFIHCLVTPNYL